MDSSANGIEADDLWESDDSDVGNQAEGGEDGAGASNDGDGDGNSIYILSSSDMSDGSLDEDGSDIEEASVSNEGAEGGSGEGDGAASERRVIDDYDENEEEDEVLRAIISEIKKPRQKPPDIKTEDFVVDMSFHPEQDLLAVATITGDVLLYQCTNEENTLMKTLEVHEKACRTIEFTTDGKDFFTTSRCKDIMLTDTETGKLKRFWDAAHTEPVYSMAIIDSNMLATGDDEGTVKLWDIRQRDSNAIFSLKEVDDYISCLQPLANKYLMATSGDGYLTTISIPGKKMYVQSEPYEEELTSMGVFRNDSKLIVSSSKGNFYAFNWGQFGYHCDAFTCPMSPTTRMIPITERIAVTAGEEGILRAMHVVPGRVLGIVGQHALAVETMDINCSGELIVSSSHDNDIRFWNIKYFEDFDDIKYNEKPNTRRALRHNLPSSGYANRADFFADLA